MIGQHAPGIRRLSRLSYSEYASCITSKDMTNLAAKNDALQQLG